MAKVTYIGGSQRLTNPVTGKEINPYPSVLRHQAPRNAYMFSRGSPVKVKNREDVEHFLESGGFVVKLTKRERVRLGLEKTVESIKKKANKTKKVVNS